jgi:hypothetical protein
MVASELRKSLSENQHALTVSYRNDAFKLNEADVRQFPAHDSPRAVINVL